VFRSSHGPEAGATAIAVTSSWVADLTAVGHRECECLQEDRPAAIERLDRQLKYGAEIPGPASCPKRLPGDRGDRGWAAHLPAGPSRWAVTLTYDFHPGPTPSRFRRQRETFALGPG